MAEKPADFFLGVFEIFAILLPGGIVLLLLLNSDSEKSFGELIPESEAALGIVLFIGSYILGHFLAAIGSILLDPLYDRYYKTSRQAAQALEMEKSLEKATGIESFLESWKHAIAKTDKYVKPTPLQSCADTYKNHHFQQENRRLGGPSAKAITNLYWWAGSIVILRNSAAASEVARLQADSKLFRSLTLVLFGVLLCLCSRNPWEHLLPITLRNHLVWESPITGILALVSLWRFMELRWKSTQRTYEYFIATEKELARQKSEGKAA